jgi:hypothetical protein
LRWQQGSNGSLWGAHSGVSGSCQHIDTNLLTNNYNAGSRQAILHEWGNDAVTPRDKISASAIAGGIAGTAGGLLREFYFQTLFNVNSNCPSGGPKNVVPGAIIFAIFGAAGQALYNRADARNSLQSASPGDMKKPWWDSKWSPMRVLSDEEYEGMLREKMLKINAEIALVDESIEALREEDAKAGTGKADDGQGGEVRK